MTVLAFDHRHSTNYGDHAVTEGALHLLAAAGITDTIRVIPPGSPVPTDDLVVYGGGDHLYSGPHLDEWLDPLIRAERAIVLPATFGPFTPADEARVRLLGRHAIAARDPASAETMRAILGREVPLLIDPAAFLPFPDPRHGRYRLWAPRRDDVGMRAGYESQRRPRETAAFVSYVKQYRAWPAPGVLLVAHSQHDVALCRAIADDIRMPWVRPTSLRQLLELYAACGPVRTSRYHGALFARMLGKRLTLRPWPAHGHKWSGLPSAVELPARKAATLAWLRRAIS